MWIHSLHLVPVPAFYAGIFCSQYKDWVCFPSVWLLLTLYRLTVSLRPATNSTSGFPQLGVSFCLRGVDSAISVEWETQSESTAVAGEVTFTSICFDVGWKLCMSKTTLQEIETVSCWVSICNTYSIFSSVCLPLCSSMDLYYGPSAAYQECDCEPGLLTEHDHGLLEHHSTPLHRMKRPRSKRDIACIV